LQIELRKKEMTFIAEKMPEEAKEKLPFKVFTDYSGDKPTLSKWAVDKERDAYFVLINKEGGAYEGTQLTKHYVLNWAGHLISISADPLDETFTEAGSTMHWRIHKLNIPDELKDKQEEVKSLIKEAFRATGQHFNGERFFAVEVEFNIIPYPTFRSIKCA
jgi:hypothetical protein